MSFWLMKSEPNTYSIDMLARAKNQTGFWDGIRNYQARNFIRDDMQENDLAFFYHSSCEVPGIVGIMQIIHAPRPDETAFDPKSEYFDLKSDPKHPRWFGVDVKLVEKFTQILTLSELKQQPALAEMQLLKRGNRLSILPITAKQWQVIMNCNHSPPCL